MARLRTLLALLLALLALPALAPAGCGSGKPPPSVVLVTLDTTRRDRLGAYGDPAARTPFFDALARSGALCRDAVVDASTTLPSHAGMLTGAVARRHGVRRNGREALGEEWETLAERLAARGFDTAAVVSSSVLSREHGLARGFARYDDRLPAEYAVYDPKWRYRALRLNGNQRRAGDTERAAAAAIDEARAPAFLWVHFIDAHQPADPPPPWRDVPGLAAYDAEVALVDRAMGRVLRRAAERLGPVVTAVLADHGEELGERGYTGHALFLHEAILRIPFAVAGPGVPRALVPGIVRQCDVAPVLARLAGAPGAFPDGRDFLAAPPAGAPALAFAETLEPIDTFGGAPSRAARTGELKLIDTPHGEFYDLRADPGETRNLWDERPRERERLAAAMEDSLAALPAPAAPAELPLDEQRLASLRALGYAAGPAPDDAAAGSDEGGGIDAKELIDVVECVRRVDDGMFDGVAERLARFRARHPRPPGPEWHPLFSRAHFCAGALRFVDGDREGARAELDRALELDPDYADAMTLRRKLGD